MSGALRGGSSHDVLSEGFGLRLTRKDLQTLSNLNWLNDEVSPHCLAGGGGGWVFPEGLHKTSVFTRAAQLIEF